MTYLSHYLILACLSLIAFIMKQIAEKHRQNDSWEYWCQNRFGSILLDILYFPANKFIFNSFSFYLHFMKFPFIYVILVPSGQSKNWSNRLIFESIYCKLLLGSFVYTVTNFSCTFRVVTCQWTISESLNKILRQLWFRRSHLNTRKRSLVPRGLQALGQRLVAKNESILGTRMAQRATDWQ